MSMSEQLEIWTTKWRNHSTDVQLLVLTVSMCVTNRQTDKITIAESLFCTMFRQSKQQLNNERRSCFYIEETVHTVDEERVERSYTWQTVGAETQACHGSMCQCCCVLVSRRLEAGDTQSWSWNMRSWSCLVLVPLVLILTTEILVLEKSSCSRYWYVPLNFIPESMNIKTIHTNTDTLTDISKENLKWQPENYNFKIFARYCSDILKVGKVQCCKFTLKPKLFVCSLFREFRNLSKFAKQ